jgi:Concanavalin A-like lectin/glucanases superfamily
LKSVTTGVGGSAGKAFEFTKKPSYVTVPDSDSLDPGTGSFSISLKVKFTVNPPASVGDYDLLRKGLSTTSGGSYKMEIYHDKALCNYRGSGGQAQVNQGPALNDGNWHTIVCARTSSKVTLTVDGTSWTKSKSTGTISNSSSLMVGAKDTKGHDQYNGDLDEVFIS